MNYEIPGKEFLIQRGSRGWRAYSHCPHYITTEWVKTKCQAIQDGDKKISDWYEKSKQKAEDK